MSKQASIRHFLGSDGTGKANLMRLLAEPKPKAAKAGPEPLPENNMMQMDWADVDANTFSTLKRPQGCAGRLLTKRLEKISNAPVKDCGDVKRVIKTFGGGIKKFEKALTPNLTHLGKSIGVWRAMFALINPTQEPQAHKIWRRSAAGKETRQTWLGKEDNREKTNAWNRKSKNSERGIAWKKENAPKTREQQRLWIQKKRDKLSMELVLQDPHHNLPQEVIQQFQEHGNSVSLPVNLQVWQALLQLRVGGVTIQKRMEQVWRRERSIHVSKAGLNRVQDGVMGPRVVSLLQAAAAGPLVQRLLDMCQGNSKDRWTTENHRWAFRCYNAITTGLSPTTQQMIELCPSNEPVVVNFGSGRGGDLWCRLFERFVQHLVEKKMPGQSGSSYGWATWHAGGTGSANKYEQCVVINFTPRHTLISSALVHKPKKPATPAPNKQDSEDVTEGSEPADSDMEDDDFMPSAAAATTTQTQKAAKAKAKPQMMVSTRPSSKSCATGPRARHFQPQGDSSEEQESEDLTEGSESEDSDFMD